MRAPYTQLYLHCVWAVWDRLPLITPQIETVLYPAIIEKCRELKSEVIAIGGIEDHTHVLVRFHTTVSVADLVKGMKGSSSHLMTHKVLGADDFFKWQGAYGAFTVSKRHVKIVTEYIVNQKKHHAEKSLWDEFEKTEITDIENSGD